MGETLSTMRGELIVETGFLTAALLLMFLMSDRTSESWKKLIEFWPILIPAMAVFLMYAMVVLEPRYLSGVTLVTWGAVAASTSITTPVWRTKVLRATSLALGGMLVLATLAMLAKSHDKNEQSAEQIAGRQRATVDGDQSPGRRCIDWLRVSRGILGTA